MGSERKTRGRDPNPQIMVFCDLVILWRGTRSEEGQTSGPVIEPVVEPLIGPLPMDTEEDYAKARERVYGVGELKK